MTHRCSDSDRPNGAGRGPGERGRAGSEHARLELGSTELDARFWDAAWRRNRRQSGFYRDTEDAVSFWNERARQFRRNTTGEAGAGRVQEVFSWLEQHGVTVSGAEVLDIGSGPGSFALPFAEAGARVTALDASPVMIEMLEAEMAAAGIADYSVLAEAWEQTDPAARGLLGAFDLVFVSMCPAVSDRAMLEKAVSCSRAFVYIMAFAGRRESRAVEAVRTELGLERRAAVPDDAFYIGNLLYTLGHAFECSVFPSSYTEEMTAEEARKLIPKTILRQEPDAGTDLAERVHTAVDRYLNDHCRDGVLHNTVENRHGRFLVRVAGGARSGA